MLRLAYFERSQKLLRELGERMGRSLQTTTDIAVNWAKMRKQKEFALCRARQ